jgi:secondary thiamine-phosphate synthase enzyme
MNTYTLTFDTTSTKFLDITEEVREFAAAQGGHGLLNVFVPHATAGLAVMETGSGSEADLEAAIDGLLPRAKEYVHSHGSPGHGADHLLPVFIAPTVTLPVVDGEVTLGTWQSVVLVDLNRDNPRRKVHLSFLSG